MVKKLNFPFLEQFFRKRSLLVFSPFDLKKHFNVSQQTASKFIYRNTKKGYLIKLRNGLYQLASENVPEELIANQIYRPSYISLEYALSFYNLIPESIYQLTSITTKPSREFVVNNISYVYHKIKRQAFNGYVKYRRAGVEYLIATPEKALVDWLYFVDLSRRRKPDRIEIKKFRKNKLVEYAKYFKRPSLNKLILKFYDIQRGNKEVIH